MTLHEGPVVGIGRAIATRLAAAGALVVVADLSETSANTVASDIGTTARAIDGHVTDEAQVDTVAAFAVDEFGSLGVMGDNAGICASAQDYLSAEQDRLGQPDDIAKVVLRLASDDAGWVTGIAYLVDAGLMAASI